MARSGLAWLVVSALLVLPASARAQSYRGAAHFTPSERGALLSGATVSRPVRFTRGNDGSYIGGVSYQVVRATPERVLAALASVETLPHALPRTESARLLASTGRSATVEITQGKAPFLVTYTVNVEQSPDGQSLHFWLEPRRPHDVRDVWGYVRVRPFGRDTSLVTLAVALDLGPGIARALFSDRIERMILRAPARIREYVEPERLSSVR